MSEEARAVWDANADFWDQSMGEGNSFHLSLIEPSQLSLLNLKPGERVLDLACGNAQFARKMASLGAEVTASDCSAKMIENARRRSVDHAIEFHIADCTNEDDLNRLGSDFDAVVCTMALMDIADLVPLAKALPRLLKPSGRFVFSVMHPCFNFAFTKMGIERFDDESKVVHECYVRIRRYIESVTTKGIAMDGQPVSQFYFHRPLQDLLRPFFDAGLCLDGLMEPVFPKEENPSLFHQVYSEMPAALVVRLIPNRHHPENTRDHPLSDAVSPQ